MGGGGGGGGGRGRREKLKAEITWLRYFSISQLREGLRGEEGQHREREG